MGRGADLSLIIGSPILILAAVTQAQRWWSAAAISSFVMIWAIGHHLPGMMRAYGDAALFSRFRVRFIVAPLLLLLASCVSLYYDLKGIVALAAIWGWWHYLMQTYGFVRIYDAKLGSYAAFSRWLDQGMCVVWFAAAVILNEDILYQRVIDFHNSGMGIPVPEVFIVLRAVTQIALAVVTLTFVAYQIHRWTQEGIPPNWTKIALMATTFAYFWYSNATIVNVLVAFALFEMFHDVQYLAIVWAFNRRRAAAGAEAGRFTQFLFRPRAALVMLYLGLVFAYGSLDYGSKLIDPGTARQVLAGVFLASTLLHYYFDGFIWKLRETSTQESLGIAGDGSELRHPLEIPGWMRHALLWSLFVVPLAYLTWSETEAHTTTPTPQELQASALESSRRLAAGLPSSGRAQRDFGLALEFAGAWEQAVVQYEQALELIPDDSQTKQSLGRVLAKQGAKLWQAGRAEEAASHARRSLQHWPEPPTAESAERLLHAIQRSAAGHSEDND